MDFSDVEVDPAEEVEREQWQAEVENLQLRAPAQPQTPSVVWSGDRGVDAPPPAPMSVSGSFAHLSQARDGDVAAERPFGTGNALSVGAFAPCVADPALPTRRRVVGKRAPNPADLAHAAVRVALAEDGGEGPLLALCSG